MSNVSRKIELARLEGQIEGMQAAHNLHLLKSPAEAKRLVNLILAEAQRCAREHEEAEV